MPGKVKIFTTIKMKIFFEKQKLNKDENSPNFSL
jgi:hypothetical protein